MAIRSLKASELTGRYIYQDKNRTIYSDSFMKNHGYIIDDKHADEYHSYTLRLFESIFACAILLYISKANLIISFSISLLAYLVLTLLFYFKFLKSLPKIENFKKTKKDGYIISTAKEMSILRILILVIILTIFTLAVIYYPIINNYEGAFKILLFGVGLLSGIFTLMNLISLIYKIIRRVH